MANHIPVKLSTKTPSAKLLDTDMYGANAVIRLQSATTETGSYTSVTTEVIISGTESYDLYDPAGTSGTWYRSRFENAAGTRLSDWSAPQPARYD